MLLLLCTVQFIDIIDFVDHERRTAVDPLDDLGFTQQQLQWVVSGYLVTYGGFLLLGGRAGGPVGRRRLLVAGTALFAVCSLAGGLRLPTPGACWSVPVSRRASARR